MRLHYTIHCQRYRKLVGLHLYRKYPIRSNMLHISPSRAKIEHCFYIWTESGNPHFQALTENLCRGHVGMHSHSHRRNVICLSLFHGRHSDGLHSLVARVQTLLLVYAMLLPRIQVTLIFSIFRK